MYEIAAFVGERKVLQDQFKGISQNYIIDLNYKPYALIPVTGDFQKAIQEKCQITLEDFAYADYPAQLQKIIEHFSKSSKEAKLAFIAAEYFGGAGGDFGFVFENDQTKIFSAENAQWPNSNMSMALKAIGVPENLQEKKDAFDMLGLGRCRRIEKWLEL